MFAKSGATPLLWLMTAVLTSRVHMVIYNLSTLSYLNIEDFMSNDFLKKQVTVTPDLVARNNDDGTIVVMRMDESNLFFKIDGVAAEVWKGINANKGLQDIFNEIKSSYDVTDEQLQSDMEKFLSDLKCRDLITLS